MSRYSTRHNTNYLGRKGVLKLLEQQHTQLWPARRFSPCKLCCAQPESQRHPCAFRLEIAVALLLLRLVLSYDPPGRGVCCVNTCSRGPCERFNCKPAKPESELRGEQKRAGGSDAEWGRRGLCKDGAYWFWERRRSKSYR